MQSYIHIFLGEIGSSLSISFPNISVDSNRWYIETLGDHVGDVLFPLTNVRKSICIKLVTLGANRAFVI